jgi:hypothetical protein
MAAEFWARLDPAGPGVNPSTPALARHDVARFHAYFLERTRAELPAMRRWLDELVRDNKARFGEGVAELPGIIAAAADAQAQVLAEQAAEPGAAAERLYVFLSDGGRRAITQEVGPVPSVSNRDEVQ